jgi:fermentation-respiration switch protein FrsA (DUF1100 family)
MSDTPRPTRRWKRLLRRSAVLLAFAWLGSILLMKWLENRLVYPGNTAAESWVPCPVDDYEDVWTTSADGSKIHGWYFPGPGPDAVVLAHGNGGNLSHRSRIAIELRKILDVSVLLFDYPGYGKSSGSPSEAGCYAAGDAMIEWLAKEKSIPKSRMILFGESLGGGVAAELAIRHEHKALVLTKSFTSLPAAAKDLFPILPTQWLMTNRYETIKKLPGIRTPVFVAHGTEDRTVPFHHGEELFAAANEPKAFHRMEGQEHNAWFTSDFYRELKSFLERTSR